MARTLLTNKYSGALEITFTPCILNDPKNLNKSCNYETFFNTEPGTDRAAFCM